jgi:hypothetical protein
MVVKKVVFIVAATASGSDEERWGDIHSVL